MNKIILLIILITAFAFAGGKIIYQDNTKIVVGCDDNKTSLIIQKDDDEFIYKDQHYQSIDDIIEEKCN